MPIFLPPKQPSCAPVSRHPQLLPAGRGPPPRAKASSRPRRPSGFAVETQTENSPRHQNEKNPENWQLVLDKCKTAGIITNVRQANIAGLCNGSTADSDSVCEGSNPSPAATKEKARSHSDCGLFPLISRLFGIPAAKTIRRNTEQIRKASRFKTQFYERIIEELSAHFYQREKAGRLPCFSCIPSLGKRSHT